MLLQCTMQFEKGERAAIQFLCNQELEKKENKKGQPFRVALLH